MNANEKIHVGWFVCETYLDKYDQGEVGGPRCGWTSRDLHFDSDMAYDSAADALKAVCDANFFDFIPDGWKVDPDDPSRFSTSVLVDEDSCQVDPGSDPARYEEWKRGSRELFSCHVSVQLEVHASRGLTREESVLS